MSYDQIGWQNKPSTATPINATNLNHMDAGIAANDTAIGTLQTAVAGKVDKVEGKGLSTNDFTDEDALKLAGIEDGAEVNVQADWDEADNTADDYIKNKPDLGVYAEKDSLWQDATASGNPVTIKTQSAQAAKSTELSMMPVQDLHGYGKPWAGGAGKNLCQPFTSGTSNNVTLTQNADGSITLSGTASSLAAMFTVPLNTPSGTTVSISLNNSTTNSEVLVRLTDVANNRYGTSVLADTVNKKSTYTTAIDYKEINVAVKTNHGDISPITLKVQVEFNNTPTDWTPWENICPISGRTGAEIVRCGKNLLEIADGVDKQSPQGNVTIKTANNGKITLNGSMSTNPSVGIWNLAVLNSTSTPQSDNKKHLSSGKYKCTNLVPGMRIQIMGSNAEDADTTNTTALVSFFVGHDEFYFNDNGFKYTWLRLYLEANASFSNVTFAPMIYQTDYSDATYAPYTGQTITIPFGSTIYGGSLDVETGVLSVEWAYIASYNGETITEPWISDRDEYVPNTTPSTGAEVAYKLATPTTATLTAAQVNLLKGLNNVSTDADGISITYFADGESLTDADNRITAVLGDFAMVEGARASQNYAIGDYLVFEDKFCKASAAIASGEVLAIGTNLTQTTIGAELKAILAQL